MEKWERWTANPEIPDKLYLQALIDDKDGLRLVFIDAHEKMLCSYWMERSLHMKGERCNGRSPEHLDQTVR
ncbi:hypothetical protein [Exiguobacterium aurantiacum]|uniref:hypothetical protein n=1 Tax=Exiguobacterium aurantiacum TaxID=33987 RepID=UPI001E41E249|nr:hypothetical protein [Exiguobacterium aurantiacum]